MVRERLESILLVLAIGAAVAIAAKRASVPYNVALVVVGLLLVLLDVLPATPIDPDVVLVGILPVLVFEGALFADFDHLRREIRPIVALAVPGVAVSLLGTAAVATWELGVPFSVAALLGALLAITDTVSVLLAFRTVRVPHRLAAIMEGESLFNDGTALVLVSLTATLVESGHLDGLAAARALVVAILGGVLVGSALGLLGAGVIKRAPDHLTAILACLVLVFATALGAEHLHASPVIAVVVAGLVIGRAARRLLEPARVLALHGFWEVAGFSLNVVVFLLAGMQVRARMLFSEAPLILAAIVALHAGRAIAVYGTFALLGRAFRPAVPARWQHVMLAGNIKGALSMAAAAALPTDLPFRDRIVTIVFGVTVVTLVTQALPFARLLRWLKVTVGAPDEAVDRAKAKLIAARHAQGVLGDLLAAGVVSRREHAVRHAALQREVIAAEATLRTLPVAAVDRHVDLSLLEAQKAAVLDAQRRGLIGLDATEHAIEDIDRATIAASAETH